MMGSNFTPSEEFRMTGTLRSEVIEGLLEAPEISESCAGDLLITTNEVAVGFAQEGFADGILRMLSNMQNTIDSRTKIQDIRDAIAAVKEVVINVQDELRSDAEYGQDQLRSLRAELRRLSGQ